MIRLLDDSTRSKRKQMKREKQRPLSPILSAHLEKTVREHETVSHDSATGSRDLRRLPRPSLEAELAARPLVTIAALLVIGATHAGAATIRVDGKDCVLADAIRAANTDQPVGGCRQGSGSDTVRLEPGSLHVLTKVEDSTLGPTGLPLITSTITIVGNGSTIQRDAGESVDRFRLISVAQTGNLTVRGLTLSGGDTRGRGARSAGGSVLNDGTLTLLDSVVSGNRASEVCFIIDPPALADYCSGGFGGGIFNTRSVIVRNSTVTRNTAGVGGGISSSGSMSVLNSTISDNHATSCSWLDSSGVHCSGSGGGVITNGIFALAGSTISGNEAASSGGGVFNGGTLSLTNSVITSNRAGRPHQYGGAGGGGIKNNGSSIVTNSTISNNLASSGLRSRYSYYYYTVGSGGGIENNGTITVTNSAITGNKAAGAGDKRYGHGGGISNLQGGALLTLSNSTISGNDAGHGGGGGIYNVIGGLSITNSTITLNYGHSGGGMFTIRGTVDLHRSLIAGNLPRGPDYNSPEFENSWWGILHADDFNFFGIDGDPGGFYATGPTDLIAAPGVTLANILAPLADNGGPTQTHRLVHGSPAHNASPIDRNCAGQDQRGVYRPQGRACDIGAFEVGIDPLASRSPTPTKGCTVNGKPDQPCLGTVADDEIIGTRGNDVIVGLDGADVLEGVSGEDRLVGGHGDDQLSGGAGSDYLFGQRGNDLLWGGEGNDRLFGGTDDDQLFGERGNDYLSGQSGDDRLQGGKGIDQLIGGRGKDQCRKAPKDQIDC